MDHSPRLKEPAVLTLGEIGAMDDEEYERFRAQSRARYLASVRPSDESAATTVLPAD